MEKKAKDFGKEIRSDQVFNIGKKKQPAEEAQEKEQIEKEIEESVYLNIGKSEKKIAGISPKKEKEKLTELSLKGLINKLDEYIQSIGKIKVADKASFFRLLAVMLNAGVPVIKSLDVLAYQTKNKKFKDIIYSLARGVESGKKLSEGLAENPKVFGDAIAGMVRSGEISGQLTLVCTQLADTLEKSASVTSKIKNAMIYPTVIFLLLIVVGFIMMITVIPKITELFVESGRELPTITTIVINISTFLQNHYILFIAIVVGLVLLIGFAKRTKKGKYVWDNFLIHIPIFGPLLKKAVLARFARQLSGLLGSGISIVEALQIDANACGNEVYRKRILMAAEDVKRGIPIGENLKDSPLFPDMVVSMISVGEQTAQLDSITEKIANYYDDVVDTAVKSLTKTMEPLILVVIGVAVGVIVAAIMLPIINLTEFSAIG